MKKIKLNIIHVISLFFVSSCICADGISNSNSSLRNLGRLGRLLGGSSGYYYNYENGDNLAEKAEGLQMLMGLIQEYREKYNSERDPIQREQYRLLLNPLEKELEKQTPIGLGNAVARIAMGERPDRICKNLDVSGEHKDLKRLGYLPLFIGAKVVGKRFEEAFDRSLGDSFLDIVSNLFSGCIKGVKQTYFKLTGRKGKMFDYNEVLSWQKGLNRTLFGLDRIAKSSSILGQRDKVVRSWEDEEVDDSIDPSWKWQRDLFDRNLRGIASCIDAHLEFYDSKKELQVVECASQIRDWILGYLDNSLLKTKSHRDLGSNANQVALSNLRVELDNSFNSLLGHINPNKRKDRPENNLFANQFSSLSNSGLASGLGLSEDED